MEIAVIVTIAIAAFVVAAVWYAQQNDTGDVKTLIEQRKNEADEAEAAGDHQKAAELRKQVDDARETMGWA